jgi:hypothetical protein
MTSLLIDLVKLLPLGVPAFTINVALPPSISQPILPFQEFIPLESKVLFKYKTPSIPKGAISIPRSISGGLVAANLIISNVSSQYNNFQYDSPIENVAADFVIATSGALVSMGVTTMVGTGASLIVGPLFGGGLGIIAGTGTGVAISSIVADSNITAVVTYQFMTYHIGLGSRTYDPTIDPVLQNAPNYDGPNAYQCLDSYSINCNE